MGLASLPFLRRRSAALPPGQAIGLVACWGQYPVLIAEKAREMGVPLVCVGLAGMADPKLKSICTEFHWLHRLSIGSVINTFHRYGVKRMTFAGKYHKHVLFRPWRWLHLLPDRRVLNIYFNRKRDNTDDSIMLAVINEFHSEGIDCVSALDLCPELLVREGTLTRRAPSDKEQRDIRFGWELAKRMGGLDVGQSVMVRDRAVLAVEAIEGTDKAILRAGDLCGKAAFTVVKVAKPNQDMRFDVPTVGPTTIESMRAAGARCLAIEAGKTILIDERDTLARAERYGMTIVALPDPPAGMD